MNSIRAIQQLNQRELDAGVSISASWHNDYRDTAWIYIGGFPFTLSEGDILTVFSQFGEPTHINLVRDKETGKSKGFCFLRYEDQRSTDLAVDNLGGADLMGRLLRVDHTRYKRRDDEDEDFGRVGWEGEGKEDVADSDEDRPVLKEEIELERIMTQYDDEDPMKKMLVQEKQEEVDKAIKRWKKEKRREDKREHKKHRHHHRDRRAIEDRTRDRNDRSNTDDRRGSDMRREHRSERNGNHDRDREAHDGKRERGQDRSPRGARQHDRRREESPRSRSPRNEREHGRRPERRRSSVNSPPRQRREREDDDQGENKDRRRTDS